MGPAERASRRAGDLVAAGLLAVVGLVFLWRSLIETPLGTLANPGPGAAPLLLAVLLVAFAIWTAAARTPPAAEMAEGDGPAEWGLAHAACIFAAIAFAASAIGYLGYRVTVLAVLLFLLGVVERKPLLITLLLGLALSFGTYALFVRVLKIPLPTGALGF